MLLGVREWEGGGENSGRERVHNRIFGISSSRDKICSGVDVEGVESRRAGELMTEWTNFVGALHGAAAAFLVDT